MLAGVPVLVIITHVYVPPASTTRRAAIGPVCAETAPAGQENDPTRRRRDTRLCHNTSNTMMIVPDDIKETFFSGGGGVSNHIHLKKTKGDEDYHAFQTLQSPPSVLYNTKCRSVSAKTHHKNVNEDNIEDDNAL